MEHIQQKRKRLKLIIETLQQSSYVNSVSSVDDDISKSLAVVCNLPTTSGETQFAKLGINIGRASARDISNDNAQMASLRMMLFAIFNHWCELDSVVDMKEILECYEIIKRQDKAAYSMHTEYLKSKENGA